MTDEVYEYQQSMQEQARAAHRTPISPTRIASEAENHKKDGPCQTIVLPNLPSVAGRVKYAMGTMNLSQFSQRTGISGSYLGQLCSGKAKKLSAYNANRIAGASSMGVTVGWLLGLPKTEEKQPPTQPPEPELPDISDFWERLEWAVKNSGKTRNAISYEIGANTDYISYSLRNRSEIRADKADPLAKALGVDKEWLFKGMDLHKEKKRNERIASLIESVKDDMLVEGISYQEMAKRIRVNKASLYYWINGNTTPNAACVKKIKYYIENLSPAAMDFKKAHDDVQKNEKSQAKSEKIVQKVEGVYTAETLAAIVSVLKGTYKVSLTLEEVNP